VIKFNIFLNCEDELQTLQILPIFSFYVYMCDDILACFLFFYIFHNSSPQFVLHFTLYLFSTRCFHGSTSTHFYQYSKKIRFFRCLRLFFFIIFTFPKRYLRAFVHLLYSSLVIEKTFLFFFLVNCR
jgi:hypothetical protein